MINLIGGVCMGCLLYFLSTLTPDAGRGTIFLWLAAFGALLAPLVFLIKPKSEREEKAHAPVLLPKSIITLILFVIFLVYGVQAGQWAVSGYMGELSKIPVSTVGFFLALSSIAGFVGAIVPAALGRTRSADHGRCTVSVF
jgi:predicted MFS family arabinose efflux permease